MKKRGLVWIATGSIIVIAIAIIMLLTGQSEMQLGKAKVDKLTEGKAIAVDSKAESFGILKGDVFLYYVDILCDSEQVSEIDIDGLIETINLEPFEVRNIQELKFALNDGIQVYRLAYELQLINGDVNSIYNFPSIVVRYKLTGSDGFQEMPVSAEPVYISSRLPESDEDFMNLNFLDLGYESPFRVLKGDIIEIKQSSLPWILLICGILLAIGAVVDFVVRVVPQRNKEKDSIRIEKNKQIAQIYNTLYRNIESKASYENIIYQIDHISRLVLSLNEHFQWLEEIDISKIPVKIKDEVTALFNNISKMSKGILQESDVNNSLQYLDNILRFYYQEDVNTWKN